MEEVLESNVEMEQKSHCKCKNEVEMTKQMKDKEVEIALLKQYIADIKDHI